MKKALVIILGVILLSGCSKNTQFTQDLTGTWFIYKLAYFNVTQANYMADTLTKYTITFTSGGQFTEQNVIGPDTFHNAGTWQFQNSFGQLVMTDTAHVQYSFNANGTFTVLNLTGNSIELLQNGYDRYMRKLQ